MAGSGGRLWALDVRGRAFTLAPAESRWRPCPDPRLELKRLSAGPQGCWAIGYDHRVYAFVRPGDIPVRVQEEAFENQRWNPVDGFGAKLLPSDRWGWSTEDGLGPRFLAQVQLPSPAWEWEGDWSLFLSIAGEPTEAQGWTYALDFPAPYSHKKHWNSCVRRRRWIRYRRYTAINKWAQIPVQEEGSYQDLFHDVCLGGWDLAEEPPGRLSVWAVTTEGKVLYRDDVHHSNPEGREWIGVEIPSEALQVSAGPISLVWVLLWEGKLLAREGVNQKNPMGEGWVVVDPPEHEFGVVQVSVGTRVIWCITSDGQVWFRRGVCADSPAGLSWVSMVSKMMMVSVGVNDQVFGVGREDRTVYFRQGVCADEASGKVWRPVVCERDAEEGVEQRAAGGSHRSSITSLNSLADLNLRSSVDDAAESNDTDSTSTATEDTQQSHRGTESTLTPAPAVSSKPSSRSPTPRAELAAGPGEDCMDTGSVSSLGGGSISGDTLGNMDRGLLWAWVSTGACDIDSQSQPLWFIQSTGSLLSGPVRDPAWRRDIVQQLTDRSLREISNFEDYESATDKKTVWVRRGVLSWWQDWYPQRWIDLTVLLEQLEGAEERPEAMLFLHYMVGATKKYLHIFISEITALVPVLDTNRHTFAVYTAERTESRAPIRLAAATEQDMHDWLAVLNTACCEARGLSRSPSHRAVWSVTCRGDVFVSECSSEASSGSSSALHMFWRQIGGHLRLVESDGSGVVWGLGYDHTAWVYTGGHGGGFLQGSTDGMHPQTDVIQVYIYENQRWNPLSGYTARGLPTDRYMWSDITGLQERTKTHTKPPSPQWTWVSDWAVDFGVPGGTDREGWQYAADFPARYHGYKTIKDFVRRRRWSRRCRLVTSGPWLEVPPLSLRHLSLNATSPQAPADSPVALWAVSRKGDVLCRLGVSRVSPAGSSWLHVSTDQPFVAVSVGSGGGDGVVVVWALALDGSAFLRTGVSDANPVGQTWIHLAAPTKQKLKHISVGPSTVFAVDEQNQLWFRSGIEAQAPCGTDWEMVSPNVRLVSVGPQNQVWGIADTVQGSQSTSQGVVCCRTGVGPTSPTGQSWDYGIGGGWDYITVRGNWTQPRLQGVEGDAAPGSKMPRP
ncbi:LOW QUALITY PROTEIN: tectonin beta-propeller repeat-containing protein 1 [Lethenteron reissneri]|uniref:LOW QUALITY PROTEIN: tectonin beta-propeller repeat-containing protein 1 n=1 Tax=Lethenteron reissneri TaxID=7753 RepID=UPI002AB7809A|nr:LOW QUALITY PROTEIN: tectonin beta-propeller repeat-containing protein 1 [Lethenteron reissneri]